MSEKPRDDETLRALEALDAFTEATRDVETRSDDEVARELRDAGYDASAVGARADAIAQRARQRADAKVIRPSFGRRTASYVPWLVAAAAALLAIGYAWKSTRPRPEDDLANRHHDPEPPPSLAPTTPEPEPTEDLVAHPPPKPCKPLPARVVKLEGTISQDRDRFVFVPDTPVCGAQKESIEELELEAARPEVDLGRFGVAHVRVDGRVVARDASRVVLRVDRVTP